MKRKLIFGLALLAIVACSIAAIAPGAGNAFSTGAVAVTDAATYVEVARIAADSRPILIRCEVGAGGAIAHFKISQSVARDASVNTLAEDTDFATATNAMPYILGSTVHQTAANGSFQVKLDSGAADYVIYAKKAVGNTTVTVTGRVL